MAPHDSTSTLPILYPPAERDEFSAIVSLVESLKPWQRAAIRDVLDMIDSGVIRPHPVNGMVPDYSSGMVTDIRRVIASHRALHGLEGSNIQHGR
jgi:hypothetical protein